MSSGDRRPGRDDCTREIFPVRDARPEKDGQAREVLPRKGTSMLLSMPEVVSESREGLNCDN